MAIHGKSTSIAAQDTLPRPLPKGEGLLYTFLAAALLLFLPAMAHAAWTHAPSVPKAVTLPNANAKAYLFLEGETARESQDDKLKDPSQKPATVFCDQRSPDDKYWAGKINYDKCRAATRGAAVNQPPHRFTWNNVGDKLQQGIYDVYIRSYITPGGSDSYSLSTSQGDVKALQEVRNPQGNISWFRLGSVLIHPETKSLTLTISTQKSVVQLDTVLLVAADHVKTSANLKRLPGKEAWASGQSLIFSSNQAAITYQAASGAAIEQVTYSIQDEAGRYLTHNAALTPWANTPGSLRHWTVKLDTPGYYNVTVNARGNKGQRSTQHVIAAVLGPPIDDALRMKSRFGVWTVHGSAKLAVLAGSRWNRAMRAFYKTTRADIAKAKPFKRAPNATFHEGLEQIGVFSFGLPQWLMNLPEGHKAPSYGTSFYPATDWDTLADVISTYATQHPLPDMVEMYNEPLAHWHGTDAQLVQYAHAVREGLKRVDRAFKVLGPCMYSIRINDLNRLIQAGLFKELDGISMHGYVNGTPPEDEFSPRIQSLKKTLADAGKADWPIYLTEFGWTRASGTWQTPVNTLTQAQYCARSLVLGMAQDVKALIYFCLTYRTSNKGEAGFSLITSEGYVSPAYVAYATVAKTFAGAQPIGQWSISPDTRLVLAQREGQVLAALWSTNGTHEVTLPWRIEKAISMTGRPMTLAPGKPVTVGESPIYLTLSAPQLAHLRTSQTTVEHVSSAAAEHAMGGLLVALSGQSPPGRYTRFTQEGDQWIAQPMMLRRPIQIVASQVRWPADRANPELAVVVRNNLKDEAMPVRITLASQKTTSVKLPPRSMRAVKFELPLSRFKPGARSKVEVAVHASHQGEAVKLHEKVDFTPMFAQRVSDVQANSWPSDAAPIDFTNWAPFPAEFSPDASPSNCRASMAAMYGSAGLRLRVWVTDDEYEAPEPHENSARLWSKDSIQLGLDMDAGKPWTAGVAGQGFGGHRVFEFSVRGDASAPGAGLVYRERSYTQELPANQIAKGVRARVVRQGDNVIYDVFFPWDTLAVKQAPKAGEAIGLALAVNDYDPRAHPERHGLRLFKGIVQTKDPKQFGRLWLR